MAVVELIQTNFERTVSGPGIVMVDCRAAWCAACGDFEPVFERVAEQHPDHTFGKLDTEREKELVRDLKIEHIPTLLLFRDGFKLFQQPGYFEEEKLHDIVRQAESVDMNAVRSHLENEKKREDDNRSQEAG